MRHPLRIVKLRLDRLLGMLILAALLSCGVSVGFYLLNINGMQQQEVGAYDNALSFWTQDQNDWWKFFGKKPTPSKQVSIIAIDEKTFQTIENNPQYKAEYSSTWPFARDMWALVFQYANDVGAKALAVDMLFFEKKDDLLMLKTLQKSKIPIVFGYTFDTAGKSFPKITPQNRTAAQHSEIVSAEPEERAAQALAFPVVAKKLLFSTFPQESIPGKDGGPAQNITLLPHAPMDTLWDRASGFGLVMTENMHGSDGVMRKTKFVYTDGRNAYVTLSLATVADLWNATQIQWEPGRLIVGDRTVRINPDGSAWIHYGGALRQRFPVVSLIDILEAAKAKYQPGLHPSISTERQEEIAAALRNRVVLIGGFASGTADLHSTPYETFVPGVIKHAAEIDCLLNNSFISDAPLWVSIVITFFVALGAAFVMLILQSGKVEVVWPLLLSALTYLAPGFLLVYYEQHILSVVPSFAAGLSSFGVGLYFKVSSVKRRKKLKDLFGHTMNPEMAELVSESNPLPDVQGERKFVTALVIDHKLFTSLAGLFEEDPALCSRILKQTMAIALNTLLQEGAYVDAHTRGSITALFGAPLPQEDAVQRACRAAHAIQTTLEKTLRTEFPTLFAVPRLSMGINSGTMWVGNINQAEQLTYAALGGPMDLTLYLERVNQLYGTHILVGPTVCNSTQGAFAFREIDWAWVPATNQMVSLYELIGPLTALTDSERQKISLCREALALYRSQSFVAALSVLEFAARLFPDDHWISLVETRCREQLTNPSDAFDGRLVRSMDIDIETEMLL